MQSQNKRHLHGMVRLMMSLLLLFVPCLFCWAQAPVQTLKSSNNQYVDLVISRNRLWAMTTQGAIKVFDLETGKPVRQEIHDNTGIVALTKDRQGNLAAVDKKGRVNVFDTTTHAWKTVATSKNELWGVAFDSQNMPYGVAPKGITDFTSGKVYFPDSSTNHQIRLSAAWIRKPVCMMDSHDRLWVGFGYGEWGGDLFVFDCKEKKFLEPNLNRFAITLSPVKSIIEAKGDVYVSSGLQHFSTSGSIVKFNHLTAEMVFSSNSYRKSASDDKDGSYVDGEYIGPMAFSGSNNGLYFYSQHGIFKGALDNDLSKIENWTKVLQPKLHWKSGQPDAIGSPMNVLKLEVLDDGKIIFVSQNDGIGIYDGKTLTMVQ